MLTELSDLQESEEELWGVDLSFQIETRSEDGEEIVHKEYRFGYAKEWDKWVFEEYKEKRTEDTTRIGDRNWRTARHVFWQDTDTATVDVPPEVSKALAKATGSDSVTIQVPSGTIEEPTYKQFTYEDEQ